MSAAIITVTGAGDTIAIDGFCTLREAITAANTNAISGDCSAGAVGLDTIDFNIAGAGVHTIQPTSPFPVVTEPVVINGYSQLGSSANTLAVGNDSVHLIEIDGTNAGSFTGGLLEISAGGSTVRGLVINRAPGGNGTALALATNGNNTIAGNFIGIDPTGTIARFNGCQGLRITTQGIGNTIGGLTPADRNVISASSGCGYGVLITSSSDNLLINNYIGTNAAGSAPLGSTTGLTINGASLFNIIGGTTAAARNVISGNQIGVRVLDATSSGNVIQGNFIGTDATGTFTGSQGYGVRVEDGASDTIVGGTIAGSGNLIALNSSRGVDIFGTPAPADTAVLGNSIFDNGSLGIDLNDDGVTANDAGDVDTGPNGLQNFPVITAVTPGVGVTTIQGTLNSTPSSSFLLQFFSNVACDPSGNGEGQTFLGATAPGTVATDGGGNVAFSVTVPTVVSAGSFITGTATNLGPTPIVLGIRPRSVRGEINSPGPTSEFSACFTVLGGPSPTPTSTVTNTPAGVPTSTPTVVSASPTSTVVPGGGGPADNIPTLSGGMLALLALGLAAIGLLLMRRA